MNSNKKLTYEDSGVNIETGYEAVNRIKDYAKQTFTPNVLSDIGQFSGMFKLPTGFKNPVLVSGTDGVGTKLKIAFLLNKHDTIGIDCVAMCINDIACQGAKPLFFLDYIGTGSLDPDIVAQIVKGISDGCKQSGVALIGGETAEMPDFYSNGEYDLAGFAVGIVEQDKMITGKTISKGDSLIGIASSGLHSNGFSLVRKLFFDVLKLSLHDFSEELNTTLGEELIKPTKIYSSLITELTDKFNIKGASHITGGGVIENVPRMLVDNSLCAVVEKNTFPVLPIFKIIKKYANLTDEEMFNTFNMGIGLVLCVDSKDTTDVINYINNMGEKAYLIGHIDEDKAQRGAIKIV